MKVVVAEDEVLIRLMLADVLRKHGFEVFEAANVAEALSILRATLVDVVITDLNMQVAGDGMLVAGYARRHGRCSLLVLASAHQTTEMAGSVFDAFFVKPYNPEDIAIWIKRRSVIPPSDAKRTLP
jgi:DNA-binding response OmpR family regulator